MNNRLIIHVDMNSFFATAEQQANPYLRGKPLGVRGSKAKRTIVAASSIEAKRLGIKTGLRVHEAQLICPDINIVVGEPRKYSYILSQLVKIFQQYSDTIEIFSIDECFIDLTNTVSLFKSKIPNSKSQITNEGWRYSAGIYIARRIKNDIRREIGEWMTCSVGISYNKFLAKFGSDLEKPDGLVVITPNNKLQAPNSKEYRSKDNQPELRATVLTVDEALLGAKLTDFCGIAGRLDRRLRRMNIRSVAELRVADDLALKNEFGVYGLKMKRWSWGVDSSPVIRHEYQPDAKSFTRARTLNRNVTARSDIKRELYLLAENLGAAMRAEGYWGRIVGVWIRYGSFSGSGKTHKQQRWICSGYDIYKSAAIVLDQLEIREAVRAIGVYVSDIRRTQYIPQSLLPEDRLQEKITETVDMVNNQYGEMLVRRGVHTKMKIKKVVSGLGRKTL